MTVTIAIIIMIQNATFQSAMLIEEKSRRPNPGMLNSTSNTSEPVKAAGKMDPIKVTIGIMAFGSACFFMTSDLERPFEYAVRI